MDVSVVISVYSIERASDVAKCIDSVKKQTFPPREIIVVVDPNEKLVNFYKQHLSSDVKLVVSEGYGLSNARNTGVKNATSEIIAFIDDDAIADGDWLKCLLRNFNDSSVVGVGGKIIPLWDREKPDWFPEELYWIVGCSYKGLPLQRAIIRNPIGCNMAFRRNLFEEVGYFSTSIGRVGNQLLSHDDTEFSIRVYSEVPNAKIVYDPMAVVYHHVAPNRISVQYVLKRSYAEGFSKALVFGSFRNINSVLGAESRYLYQLVLSPFSWLLQINFRSFFSRALLLWASTIVVLIAFFIGLKINGVKK
ncbi:MAG: glycosyltransferase [Candidatus Bathyarchaeia archaeon]